MKHFKENIIKKNIESGGNKDQEEKNDLNDPKYENDIYNDLFNEIDQNLKNNC